MYQRNNTGNLHSKEECPNCHSVFTVGFDPSNLRKCPSCNKQFYTGQNINHGSGCSICLARSNKNNGIGAHTGSNNIHFREQCPALMSDGRFITYYNSSNELTENLRKMNGIISPNEFRNFMQKHGDQFMKAERDHVVASNTCSPKTSCSEGWQKLWALHGNPVQKS